MKQLYKILFSALLATFFVVAGSGYNVVHYCCEECAKHGIVEVATHSCEEFHHPNKNGCSGHHHINDNDHRDMASTDVIRMNDGCHLLRLHTDTPSIQYHAISFGVDVYKLLLSNLHTALLFQLSEQNEAEIAYPPPLQQNDSGREILKKISVLLI